MYCSLFLTKSSFFEKSKALCSLTVSRRRRDNFTNISSIRIVNNVGKYKRSHPTTMKCRVSKTVFNPIERILRNDAF